MKRYIYIIIGIIIAAALVILVLFLVKNRSGGSSLGATGTTTSSGSLPTVGTQEGNSSGTLVGTLGLSPIVANSSTSSSGGQMTVQSFGVLSNDPIMDYFVATDNTITAVEPTGVIVSITNGQTSIVNSSTVDGIISASFSYDGKKAIVSFGNPADPQAEVFDVASNTWTPLPQEMESPQWSPAANYQIAYLTPTNNGELSLDTVDATNFKKAPSSLLTLNAQDLALQWPTPTEFILSDKPTSENDGSIWAFNTQAGTLSPLVYETPGAEGIWSHNASIPYGLVFFNNPADQGNTLQLQAISGSLKTEPLSFSTLPSKCVFNTEQMPVAPPTSTTSSTPSSTTPATKNAATSTPYLALYCGIPRPSSGFSSAHLPDDYDMMALFTSDDIYKVNTATGAEQVLWSDPTQSMDVSDMKFANNALFFVNRYDQRLYGLTFTFSQ